MADYLLPSSPLSVTEKSELFNIRCEMNEIPFNYGKHTLCEMGCNVILNNEHLLNCCALSEKKEEKSEFKHLLNSTINQKI